MVQEEFELIDSLEPVYHAWINFKPFFVQLLGTKAYEIQEENHFGLTGSDIFFSQSKWI